MAFEQSVRALFSHYGAIRRIMIHREKDVARVAELRRLREEAGKRGAEVKAVVDRAKRAAEESDKSRADAVRALGLANVEKADLVKEVDSLKVEGACLKDENLRLQKVVESMCQPQVDDVRQFLDSAEGASLAGEIRLSGGLDLLEKIQKRFPNFEFRLEDLMEEHEVVEANVGGPNQAEPDQVMEVGPSIEAVAGEPTAET
ncbi:hypothetical protein Pyn_05762 [Prunus yedoensis var. nudiflora]|uniref:Uncharacterized protein n=1 Tax=Prunus yedoensis var. nudiflora TaxID=2094558 RepID=A0A314YLM3_PRUYE|nr:hypothetical protein Pyn_05762 [Prunus yedoensis var. nudiflora]